MALTDEQQKLVASIVRSYVEERVDDRVDRALRPLRLTASVLGVASVATLIGVLIYVFGLLPDFAGERAVSSIMQGKSHVGLTVVELNKRLLDAATELDLAKAQALRATAEFNAARTSLEESRVQLADAKSSADATMASSRQAIEVLKATNIHEAGEKITWLNAQLKDGDPAKHLLEIDKRLNIEWQPLTLADNFVAYGDIYARPEVAIGHNGAVSTRGLLSVRDGKVADKQIVLVLPENARPDKQLIFLAQAHNGPLRLDVQTDGAVRIEDSSRNCAWIALDNLAFFRQGRRE